MTWNCGASGLLAAVCLCWVAGLTGEARAQVEILPTEGRNVYRLAVGRLDAENRRRQIVGATWDQRVCAFSEEGKHRWDAALGGFVFDLAAGELDGDGRDEIAAAAADGFVYLLSADGVLRWRYDLGAPVWQVGIARLDGKTPVVLAGGVSRQVVVLTSEGSQDRSVEVNGAVRLMRAGDFDGDGRDEVAVLPVRGQAQDMLFLEGPSLVRGKQRIATVRKPWDSHSKEAKEWGDRFRTGQRLWTGSELKSANGAVGDLDGDGAAELVYPPGAYTLRGGLRQTVALPAKFKTASYDYFYNMRLPAAGDLTDAPGHEIVLVEGPQVRLYGSRGEPLGGAVAPLGFTDAVYLPGTPRGTVILGSSPNGDDNLYRLRFGPGWQKALEGLQRQGVMARIGANLRQLADAAATWQGEPLRGRPCPLDVVVSHHLWSGWDPKRFDTWVGEVKEYRQKFPYPTLRFSTCFWPGEDAPLVRPDGKPWERDRRLAHDLSRRQIADGARHFEAAGCDFWVQVGHGCAPHLEVATVEAILAAAPSRCLGFVSAEDEQIEDVPYYFEHHVRPILDLCLKHRKRFIPRNKDIWWVHWPSDPRLRQSVFGGRYRSVLLPCVEDSNSRVADAQLAARVGLWLAGQVDDWASRCSADWFCAGRAWEWEYGMTGHPQLRYYVSQALLGARVFMMLNGERSREGGWTRVGTEGTATFLHLLGKGIIAPPAREQLRAVSPLALVVQQPSERFIRHGSNGHHEEQWAGDGSDARAWAFDRLDCYWAQAPLPPTDVSTYLWGRSRRSALHIPVTAPLGMVCLVPQGTDSGLARWSVQWSTDGDRLAKGGREVPLEEARRRMLADLEHAAERMPFCVKGSVFQQIVAGGEDRYLVALVDPGWLDPADRSVVVSPRLPGNWTATDRITGRELNRCTSGELRLVVPAGSLRLVQWDRR